MQTRQSIPLLLALAALSPVLAQGQVFVQAESVISEYTTSGAPIKTNLVTGLGASGGLVLDGDGNLFVTDHARNAVGEYAKSGAPINASLIRGLNNPGGLALDGDGNLYVADTGNYRIGAYTTSGHTNNANLIAGLGSGPLAVALDGNGNLFVATRYAIAEYTTTGEAMPTTVAASAGASLMQPPDIATICPCCRCCLMRSCLSFGSTPTGTWSRREFWSLR